MFDMTETAVATTVGTKSMGAAPREFFRQVRAFSNDARIDEAKGEARIDTEEGTAILTVAAKPARRLGALTLPVSSVSILLEGFSEAAANAFLASLQKSTLRMGG